MVKKVARPWVEVSSSPRENAGISFFSFFSTQELCVKATEMRQPKNQVIVSAFFGLIKAVKVNYVLNFFIAL